MTGLRPSVNFIGSNIESIDSPILFSQKGVMLGSYSVKQHGADAKIEDKASRVFINIRNQLFVVISSNPNKILIYTGAF